jgi:hypothetical protein
VPTEPCPVEGVRTGRVPMQRPVPRGEPEMTATTTRSARHRVPLFVSAVAVAALGGVAGVVPAGVASAASGNGVSSLPPSKIVETGLQTTEAARSFTAVGHVSLAGTTIGLHVTDAGNGNGSGTIVADGLAARFVKVGDTVYVRASDSFWRHAVGAKAAKKYDGKWIDASLTNSSLASAAEFLDARQFFHATSLTPTSSLVLKTTGKATVGGHPAVVVSGRAPTTGSGGPSGTIRYMVATTGKPYLLLVAGHLQAAGLSVSLSVTFSNLDQAIKVVAPSGAVAVTLPTTTTTSTTAAG